MTGITIFNVQRALIPKPGDSELWFLCSAYHIKVTDICTKFQENISQFSSYRVDTSTCITEITIFNVQKAITPKVVKQS